MNSGGYASTAAFVNELAAAGVEHVCFAPGSRSTPLALLFAEHPQVHLWTHLDERSAAFFALGLAKSGQQPVALLCTSGTAAANFLPAIVEAYYSRVPLVVLTADRPPEARELHSPQTIDQVRLYGTHVKWFVEMPLPGDDVSLKRHSKTTAARAVATALEGPPGPVHVNFPFREPLIPGAPLLNNQRAIRESTAYNQPRSYESALYDDEVEKAAKAWEKAERAVIVCGPQEDPALASAVSALAAAIGAPILADPLSRVRLGPHNQSQVVSAYDILLRHKPWADAHSPDLIVRLGAPPTSKVLTQYLQKAQCPQFLIDPWQWRDPTLSATEVLRSDPVAWCRALAERLHTYSSVMRQDSTQPKSPATKKRDDRRASWLSSWLRVQERVYSDLQTMWKEEGTLSEPRLYWELARALPDGATLFVGNSMPIRDVDAFFPAGNKSIRIMANRGANGIDGVVSTALGVAARNDSPLTLVLGDLSFYHDLNGLLAAKLHKIKATIIVVHNDGGGIFSFLPQAEEASEHFESLFGTPHGLDFRGAVEMYGGLYVEADSSDAFRHACDEATHANTFSVIVVKTERQTNAMLHQQLWSELLQDLSIPEGLKTK